MNNMINFYMCNGNRYLLNTLLEITWFKSFTKLWLAPCFIVFYFRFIMALVDQQQESNIVQGTCNSNFTKFRGLRYWDAKVRFVTLHARKNSNYCLSPSMFVWYQDFSADYSLFHYSFLEKGFLHICSSVSIHFTVNVDLQSSEFQRNLFAFKHDQQ